MNLPMALALVHLKKMLPRRVDSFRAIKEKKSGPICVIEIVHRDD